MRRHSYCGSVSTGCSKCGLNLSASIHKLKPRADPMILAAKRAYRGSNQHRLDLLVAEELKWRRRMTIAHHKLTKVQGRIYQFLEELVKRTSDEKSRK